MGAKGRECGALHIARKVLGLECLPTIAVVGEPNEQEAIGAAAKVHRVSDALGVALWWRSRVAGPAAHRGRPSFCDGRAAIVRQWIGVAGKIGAPTRHHSGSLHVKASRIKQPKSVGCQRDCFSSLSIGGWDGSTGTIADLLIIKAIAPSKTTTAMIRNSPEHGSESRYGRVRDIEPPPYIAQDLPSLPPRLTRVSVGPPAAHD
jgi:hypothetical protein